MCWPQEDRNTQTKRLASLKSGHATQPLIVFILGLGVECLEELKHLEVNSCNFNHGEKLRVKKLQSIISDDLDPTTSEKYSTQTGNLLLVCLTVIVTSSNNYN